MTCNRCLTDKPDSDFPLGEKICRECKNQANRERRLKKKQIEQECKRQIEMIFGGVRED